MAFTLFRKIDVTIKEQRLFFEGEGGITEVLEIALSACYKWASLVPCCPNNARHFQNLNYS